MAKDPEIEELLRRMRYAVDRISVARDASDGGLAPAERMDRVVDTLGAIEGLLSYVLEKAEEQWEEEP